MEFEEVIQTNKTSQINLDNADCKNPTCSVRIQITHTKVSFGWLLFEHPYFIFYNNNNHPMQREDNVLGFIYLCVVTSESIPIDTACHWVGN